MFKKNILPIFLLALVVVLSVFYIKQAPADSSVVGGDTNFETETVSSDFANKRLEVLTARSDEIDELECMVASGEYNDSEIASIIDKINQLYYIKYTEVELEDAIVMLGYDECLVLIDEYNVDVSIETDTMNYREFIEIANLVKGKLTENYKVTIETISKTN